MTAELRCMYIRDYPVDIRTDSGKIRRAGPGQMKLTTVMPQNNQLKDQLSEFCSIIKSGMRV